MQNPNSFRSPQLSSTRRALLHSLMCSHSQHTEPSLKLQQNLKKLRGWFSLWRQWQKRVAVCRLLEQCPLAQLEFLATSLEPLLHLDFANSLKPLSAALHQEGAQSFYVQRAFRRSPLKECEKEQVLERGRDENHISITAEHRAPSRLIEEEETMEMAQEETVFHPALPVHHPRHNVSLPSTSEYWQHLSPPETDPRPFPSLHRKLNSVPDIRSTTNLLHRARGEVGSGGRHRKTKSFGQLRKSKDKQQCAEEYKKQLTSIATVCA